MQRGEVWWAVLRLPEGSEPGCRRPVLIVQSDEFNKSRVNTIVAITLTSNLRLQAAPGNVLLTRRSTRLPKDSVANVSQIITLDKSFLIECLGTLNAPKMKEVDDGLRLVLDV